MTEITVPSESVSATASGSDDDVRAALTFIVPQDTKPYFESSALTGGVPQVFFESTLR